MDQLALTLERPEITGHAALRFLADDARRRLLERGLVKRGVPFYLCHHHTGGLHVWNGRGRVPEWVRQWQRDGGDLDALKAVI